MLSDLTLILDGTTVADGSPTGAGVVEDWATSPAEIATERSALLLAAYPRFFDLATLSERLVVAVGRQHASYRAAFAFERQHRAAIASVGDVGMSFSEDGVAVVCSYTDAKIGPIQIRRDGVFTLTSYALEFSGAPTITEDGDPLVSMPTVDYLLLAVNATGTSTPEIVAGVVDFGLHVQATGGAGAYTHKIVLATADRESGHIVEVRLEIDDTEEPTIEIRNATAGGTLLYTVTSVDTDEVYALRFRFNGTAWVLMSSINEPQ